MKPKFPTKYIAFTQYYSQSHKAVDIPYKVTVNGTKYDNYDVFMTCDAKVITNSYASDYGYYVEYEYYDNGVRCVVGDGHFDNKSNLIVGRTYPQGTFINKMGNKGTSSAIHDHHRLSRNGVRVDPLKYEYVYPDQIVGSLEKAKLMYYTPGPTPPTPSGDIIIQGIQTNLNAWYGAGIVVDGYYGNATHKALVKALQHELNRQYRAGLVEDGIFGTKTKNACPVVRKGATGRITYLIQAMLYCHKYNVALDEIYGNDTKNKVEQFQRDNGLVADGIVGKNTFEKLFK